MSIGASIALLILGAILAFGVEDRLPSIDLFAIGIIIMVGGAIGLILGIVLRMGRARVSTTEVTERQETPDGDVVIRHTDREVLDDDIT